MAYLSGRLVQLVSPQNGAKDVTLDSTIRVWFSKDIDTSTISPETIRLFDAEMNPVPCSVVMDPSNPTRIALLTPTSLLEPSTRYLCVVVGGSSGVRSVKLGDSFDFLFTDYNWNFTTDAHKVLTPPSLVAPINQSLIYDRATTFEWTSVDGADKYQMQISKEKGFSSIVFSNDNISSNSFVPSAEILAGVPQIYFWRVRAVDSSGMPSSWSSTSQFYVDDPHTKGQDSFIDLEVLETFPQMDSAEIPLGFDRVVVRFSNLIDENSIGEKTFIIEKKGIAGWLLAEKVSGSIEVDEDKAVFVSDEPFEENSEYRVVLKKSISSESLTSLYDNVSFTFAIAKAPYYSTIEIVRNDLGKFVEDFSDLEIAKTIHGISLWADQIANQPYGSTNSHLAGEVQQGTTNEIFFHEYVRYETNLRLLIRRTLEHALTKGEAVRLGDFNKEMTGSLVPDINVAIKRFEEKRDEALEDLTAGEGTSSLPAFATLGILGDPPRYSRRMS